MKLRTHSVFGTLLAAGALAVPATQAIPATAAAAQAHIACSYDTIGGQRRCLSPGEFCARANQGGAQLPRRLLAHVARWRSALSA